MGPDNTLEVITVCSKEREKTEGLLPTLVIALTSLLGNWRKEEV
jgi:SNF2 family DNA or RNA helicase